MIKENAPTSTDSLITLAGQTAEMLSFNRSIGQLFGLLYMSSEPLSLEDISKTCRMSKGNASIHLRTLEGWGAVHRSGKPGTRKDYYMANTDLKGLAYRRIQEGVGRRLGHFRTQLKTMKQNPELFSLKTPETMKRLDELESILNLIEKGYGMLPKLYEMRHLLGKGIMDSFLGIKDK